MKARNKKKPAPSTQASGIDLGEVTRILQFMDQNNLEEFEYENGNFHVRLRKSGMHAPATFRTVPPAPEIVVAHPTTSQTSLEPTVPPGIAAAGEATQENLHVIKSPIVGTFYAAPSPGAESLVHVGDQVAAGQVLCIIEAMKLMNEIESDVAGEVMRVFVENGQPVEYGEPLFAIHPKRKQ